MRNATGSRTIARPSATRWRWPPDSCFGLRLISGSRSRISAARRTRRSMSAAGGPCDCAGRTRGCRTPSCADRARTTGTPSRCRAMLRRDVVDDAVADQDAAARDSSSPASMRSAVLLPQPDGPTSTMNSPSWISSDEVVDGRRCRRNLRHVVEGDARHAQASLAGFLGNAKWAETRNEYAIVRVRNGRIAAATPMTFTNSEASCKSEEPERAPSHAERRVTGNGLRRQARLENGERPERELEDREHQQQVHADGGQRPGPGAGMRIEGHRQRTKPPPLPRAPARARARVAIGDEGP